MSKGKRKPPKQGIVNSRIRDSQRLALEPRTKEESRFLERGLGSVANDTRKPTAEMQRSQGYTLDQLDQRRAEVSEGERKLDPAVRLLFEQERDGNATSTGYKDKLLQPNVASDSVFDAIELGIKAWAPTLLSKEH